MARIYQIHLVLISLLTLSIIAIENIIHLRYIEAIIFPIILLPTIILAYFSSPKVIKINILWDITIFGLAYTKHSLFPCDVKVEGIFTFSLLWSIGQASILLSILQLFQKEKLGTKFYFYTLLTIVCASCSQLTWIFGVGLSLYMFTLITCGRKESLYQEFIGNVGKKLIGIMIGIVFIFAGICFITLAYYREEINNWNPFVETDSNVTSGFSLFSDLHSVNIVFSNKVVLRYFAPKNQYYLRGRIFDHYESGSWRISEEKRNIIWGKEEKTGEYLFNLEMENVLSKNHQQHKITRFDSTYSIIFAPLETKFIELSNNRGPLYANQEGIIWGTLQLPQSIVLYIQESNIEQKEFSKNIEKYLQVPSNLQKFCYDFATRIVQNCQNDEEKILAIQQYLHKNYSYQTKIKLSSKQDPIENFLLQQNGGHCELFSSTFVMLARSIGIPCRYITGYYAHEWNRWGNFITVRECDAHAWVEVFTPQKGWQSIEATASNELQSYLSQNRQFWNEILEGISYNTFILFQYVINIFEQYKFFIAIILCILLIIYLMLKRFYIVIHKKYFDSNIRKVFIHVNRDLAKKWIDFCKFFGIRPTSATLREWLLPHLQDYPEAIQQYGQELLEAIESNIYQQKEVSPVFLKELEIKWPKIKKMLLLLKK